MRMIYMAGAAMLMTTTLVGTAIAAEPAETCFVEQNFYYPEEGKAEELLALRTRGSEIRASHGLPAGRVFVVEKATSGHPSKGAPQPLATSHVMSVTEYADEASYKAARAQIGAVQEYRDVVGAVGKLLANFEQITWRPAWGGCRADGS